MIALIFTTYFDYVPSKYNSASVMDAYINEKNNKIFMMPNTDSALLIPDVENILKITGENETVFETIYNHHFKN